MADDVSKMFSAWQDMFLKSQAQAQKEFFENFKKTQSDISEAVTKKLVEYAATKAVEEIKKLDKEREDRKQRRIKTGASGIANVARLGIGALGGPLAPFLKLLDQAIDFDKQTASLLNNWLNKKDKNKSESSDKIGENIQTSTENSTALLTSVQNIEQMLKKFHEDNQERQEVTDELQRNSLEQQRLLTSGFGGRLASATGGAGAEGGQSLFSRLMGGLLTRGRGLLGGEGITGALGGLKKFLGPLGAIIGGGLGVYAAGQNVEGKKGQSFWGGGEGEGGFFKSRGLDYLAGGAGGALMGAQLGTMILPGLGTAIGGALGGIFGAGNVFWHDKKDEIQKTVGGWMSSLSSMFSGDGLFGKLLSGMKDLLSGVWDKLTGVFNIIKEKTPEVVKQAIAKAPEVAAKAVTAVKETAGKAYEGAKGVVSKGLGALSAFFESGKKGGAAVGYDTTGGTSYGKYQIASKAGKGGKSTMDAFLKDIEATNPEWARRLKAAGPANTGSKSGAFADEWKKIAGENPEAFEAAQHEFIKHSHFDVGANALQKKTGFDITKQPKAIQDVFWSTAVQHGGGGASGIFAKALAETGGGKDQQALLDKIYAIRGTKFGRSTAAVQKSVAQRFAQESAKAKAMLASGEAVPLAAAKGVSAITGKAAEVQYARQEPESKKPVVHVEMPKTKDTQMAQASSSISIEQIPNYISDEGLVFLNLSTLLI